MKINDKELDKVNGGYVTYDPETGTYRVYDNDSGKLVPSYPSPRIDDPAAPGPHYDPWKDDNGTTSTEIR